MKIKKLQIKNYKNLDADLVHNSDLIAFIGNNGSGKSNLLEAVSIIFYNLYNKKEKDIPFNFTLEYEIGGNKLVSIEKKNSSVTTKVDNVHKTEVTGELPRQVIAIYSGEEDRLWRKSYAPFYFEYIKNINAADNSKLGEFIQFPKMLFINKFYWHISLLCLLISDDSKIQEFCNQILNIKKINSIKFQFNKSNYDNYSESPVKNFIKNIDAKSEYSISDLKKVIAKHNYTTSEVYKNLYIAFTPDKKKMLENIILKFNDENLEVEDLSEGEKKLLLIKGALEYAGQEDSVFILDEPDAHIHINNKEQITNSFQEYLHNRQIIITTHSPTLTQCVKDENVYMLNSGKIEDRSRQEIIQEVTDDFWNKHQQSSFLSSKKPIILLVEGIHDKEHITNAFNVLKDEFEGLDFGIYVMGSACNIPPMMVGLRTCDIEFNKIFIGVFDDDNTGRIELDKTNSKYPNEQNTKRHKLGYYGITYPYHNDFNKSKNNSDTFQFIVENMFDAIEYENAYKEALNSFSGDFKGKSVHKINEDIKDKSKNILYKKSKEFTTREDFKHFRKLFQLITEIKEHSKGLSSPKQKAKTVTPVATPITVEAETTSDIIEIFTKRRNTDVIGHFDPISEKVTIQAGSIISADVVPSYKANEETERNKLKKKHCEFVDDKWTVKTPIEFASPSGAIKFGVGSNINGWKYWILKETKAELETIRKK